MSARHPARTAPTLFAALVVAAGLVLTPQAALAGSRTPVLGHARYSQPGIGKVKPKYFAAGGDGISQAWNVRWYRWGAKHAIGHGTAPYARPGVPYAFAKPAKARIVAYRLGTCHGKRAYTRVVWYFPSKGQHFSTKGAWKICH